MVVLAQFTQADPTLEALDAAIVAESDAEAKRGYLGMSAIGGPCDAQLWYSFRFADQRTMDARGARAIMDGHRGEDLMAARLRMVPNITLTTIDPATGNQLRFRTMGGHFSGGMDGVILGLLQSPKTYHVWEHKVSAKWEKLAEFRSTSGEKTALEKWEPKYYGQAQMYMHYSELGRHYTTVDSPGGRNSTSVRTEYNKEAALALVNRAERVIGANEPPQRISENPSWYQCKFCPAASVCHGLELPKPNCRTCMHATPEPDGDARWSCALKRIDLTLTDQLAGCEHHVYIPALMKKVGYDPVDADETENRVIYQVGQYKVGNGTVPGDLASVPYPVLPSSAWQHIVPQMAVDMLRLVIDKGAVPVAHEVGMDNPMPAPAPPPVLDASAAAIRALTEKQILKMYATPGSKRVTTKPNKKGDQVATVTMLDTGEVIA
jgi:hypothetical protein